MGSAGDPSPWRRCPELLVLAGCAVLMWLVLLGLGAVSVYFYVSYPTSLEECMNSKYRPDIVGLIGSAIETVFSSGLVVLVCAAFQSGVLDLGETKQDAGEEEEN
jgi:hypothetical protein